MLPKLFGPILPWEMTTLARRRRYFLLRAVYLSILLFLLWVVHHQTFDFWSRYQNRGMIAVSAMFAQAFFSSFTFLQLAAVLVLAPAAVATAITVEKERRTIEYLFASDLRNQEIVLGKYVARLLNLAMLILGALPVLSLATLFGGIDPERLFLLFLVTLGVLCSTGAIAMLVSVHADNTRWAVSRSYSFLGVLLFSPLLAYGALEIAREWSRRNRGAGLAAAMIPWLEEAAHALYSVHPLGYFSSTILSMRGSSPAGDAAAMLGFHMSFTAVLLAVSALRLRTVYRARVSGGSVEKRPIFARRERKVRPVWNHAMAWKEWRIGAGIRTHWFVRGIGGLLLLAMVLPFPIAALERFFSIFSMNSLVMSKDMLRVHLLWLVCAGSLVAWLLSSVRAASSIAVERDKDTWTTLLASDFTASEILVGKYIGALKPLAAYLALFLAVAPFAIAADALAPLAVVPLVLLPVPVGATAASIGLFQSLRSKSNARAIFNTVGILSIFLGVGHLFLGTFFVFASSRADSDFLNVFYTGTLPWYTMGASVFLKEHTPRQFVDYWSSVVVGIVFFSMLAALFFGLSRGYFEVYSGRLEEGAGRGGPAAGPKPGC